MLEPRHAAPAKRGVSLFGRLAGAAGALCAGAGVAMAAYASHGVTGQAASWLQTAALFAFGHGAAVALLSALPARALRLLAMALLLVGMLLFSGSLAGAALLAWPTALAPFGGSLMMLGWLLLAIDLARG